ncbi:copper transport protein ATX1-like [Cucurbita pepo subsp. pepo]|uniref:copper transport protein ATX1-like n=1 Tax=Cucurbita pepo subsp. pepo TaxID=3664 RepID=UPI000C9D4C88|nr:copper transport protein ATX1-like [Cucurbita pepo subsp. pepo]
MSQTTVLKVAMSCQGCVGAVRRVLGKLEGVETFDIDIDAQKVTVKGNVERDVVFQTVSKTGKKTAYWEDEAPAAAPAPVAAAAAAPAPAAAPAAAPAPVAAPAAAPAPEAAPAAAAPPAEAEAKPAESVAAV